MSVSNLPNLPIDHPFGKSHRWNQILNSSTMTIDEDNMLLHVKCDIKAYDSIYELFYDWLSSFVEYGTMITQGEDQDDPWTQYFNTDV